MRKGFAIFEIIIPLVLVIFLTSSTFTDRIQRQTEFNERYAIYAIDLPLNPAFAGETIPLFIDDVRDRFDKELLVNTYWQSQTLMLLKRKTRWFGIIEPILKKNGIPDDFKYLALAESGLSNVVSPSGAVGFWQFLETTGVRYGLEISDEVDERYHVEKSTQAACDFFKEAYSRFNKWSLVAAAYNMGMEGLRKQIETQKTSGYFDLLLNDETSRYVFRIVVLKEICNDPIKYGFHLRQRDFYQPYHYSILEVDSSITDMAGFARGHGINYKELKLLNPWLRTAFLSNKNHKIYNLKILNKSEPPGNGAAIDSVWKNIQPSKEFHQE